MIEYISNIGRMMDATMNATITPRIMVMRGSSNVIADAIFLSVSSS